MRVPLWLTILAPIRKWSGMSGTLVGRLDSCVASTVRHFCSRGSRKRSLELGGDVARRHECEEHIVVVLGRVVCLRSCEPIPSSN
eukprot:86480-Prorocentrum_minimum.AAC.1